MTYPAVSGRQLFIFLATLSMLLVPARASAQEQTIAVNPPPTFSLTAVKQELPRLKRSDIDLVDRSLLNAGRDTVVQTVNWAPYVGFLAERWFGNLRAAENRYGLSFQTSRPALIQFTCYADGHIGNVVLKQSSGIPLYDRIQVQALLDAAPLPPFPKGTQRQCLTLTQGWEAHRRRPGEQEFEPTAFASRFPQESVSRWAARNQYEMQY